MVLNYPKTKNRSISLELMTRIKFELDIFMHKHYSQKQKLLTSLQKRPFDRAVTRSSREREV